MTFEARIIFLILLVFFLLLEDVAILASVRILGIITTSCWCIAAITRRSLVILLADIRDQLVVLELNLNVVARIPSQLIFIFVVTLLNNGAGQVCLLWQAVIAANLHIWICSVDVFVLLIWHLPLLLLLYPLKLRVCQLHQLESFPILLSHIITVLEAFEVELEMEHLLILVVMVEANNGHAIVELERERVHTVVDEDDVT